MSMSLSPRRSLAAPAVGLLATVALAAAAASRHPQGNTARLLPFAIAAGVVWTAVVGAVAGRRAAALTACGLSAAGFLTVAVYIFFVQPIGDGECGLMFQALSRPGDRDCVSAGQMWAVAGSALAAIGPTVAAVWLKVRTRRA